MLTPDTRPPTPLSGMALAAVAFALMTSVDTIFKLVALGGHPAYQILFINAFFAIVPIVGWSLLTGGLHQLRTAHIAQHLVRGAAGVMAAFAAIYAYSRVPLASFYAIVFAGPLIVTTMSAFWLGEKVDNVRWAAIIFGFLGVMVVVNPFATSGSAQDVSRVLEGRFAALISVFCYALSIVMLRRMRLGESNLSFALYGYVTAIVIGGVWLTLSGGPPLYFMDFVHLAMSGTLAGIASLCLMTAYHRTPVALVAPFQYTQIFWGALAGYVLWNNVPGTRIFVGAAIVALSGLFVIYREMRVKTAN